MTRLEPKLASNMPGKGGVYWVGAEPTLRYQVSRPKQRVLKLLKGVNEECHGQTTGRDGAGSLEAV